MSEIKTTSRFGTSTPTNVWLVEDHALFRETMMDLIQDAPGLQCTNWAASCEELFTALDSEPLPDVILMDIGLPGISGTEGVLRVKAVAPAVEVVMLTVHHDDDKIFEAICAGASGYLLKIARPEEIVGALEQIRTGGAPIDARIARRVLQMFARLMTPASDFGLSEREREILQYLVDGRTKRQIAEALFLSPHTIDGHVRRIYAKLQVRRRTGAVAKALKERIVRPS